MTMTEILECRSTEEDLDECSDCEVSFTCFCLYNAAHGRTLEARQLALEELALHV